jgi:hypothetical protein
MTAIAQKLRKPYKFKTTFMGVNQKMYRWADNLFFNELISGSLLHTLKAIIATRHMKQPTIQQINEARTRSASTKFAQSDSVTNRTIMRHIEKLEALKYIKVTRDKNAWYSRNAYSICVPNDYLVKAPSDTMSPSLSCSSSPPEEERGAIHNFKKETTQAPDIALGCAAQSGVPTTELPEQPPAWQDEMCDQYTNALLATCTEQDLIKKGKLQFQALRRMLRK